ncbi:phosphoribosylanthranilate isomerase [Thermodesulfobacteriota bacterium]
MNKNKFIPQVKICGLTRVEEALGCVDLGVDAIGCVFYPKSPRNLTEEMAKSISLALPRHVKSVGVFVNESFNYIMRKVERCHLKAVQLHGQEPPQTISRLRKENLLVIKALFIDRNPPLDEASRYDASAFLLECGKGKLPGGNAMVWNWEKAYGFSDKFPLILAGGLSPENVSQAVNESVPDAVDVSSAVESVPGRKDLGKVKAFMDAISEFTDEKIMNNKERRKIF